MKPFGALIAERSQDAERCVREASALLDRCAGLSGSRTITLEQASWLGAIVFIGLQAAKKQIDAARVGNVVTITATDTTEAKDSAA
jgi:hypothetical protein